MSINVSTLCSPCYVFCRRKQSGYVMCGISTIAPSTLGETFFAQSV